MGRARSSSRLEYVIRHREQRVRIAGWQRNTPPRPEEETSEAQTQNQNLTNHEKINQPSTAHLTFPIAGLKLFEVVVQLKQFFDIRQNLELRR
jgi:hypothetical protein